MELQITDYIEDFPFDLTPQERLICNRALMYGEGVFATIRVENTKLFNFESHVHRLIDSWLAYYPEEDPELIRSRLNSLKFNIDHGYVKVFMFAIDEKMRNMFPDTSKAPFIVAWSGENNNSFLRPCELKTVKRERGRNSKIKCNDYRFEIHSYRKSECLNLFVNSENLVLEASYSNIGFIDKFNNFIFPYCFDEIYEGITVNSFCDWLDSTNSGYMIRDIRYNELESFKSAFLISSLSLIRPVSKIDDLEFSTDNVSKIYSEFKNYVADQS